MEKFGQYWIWQGWILFDKVHKMLENFTASRSINDMILYANFRALITRWLEQITEIID